MKPQTLPTLLIFFYLISLPVFGNTGEQVSFTKGIRTGTISDPRLSEISGLFPSMQNSPLFWAVNDSGNPPELYAISPKGTLVKTLTVQGAENIDWEDLSGFRYRAEPYLLIADVGDNWARRRFCSLYAVKEPDLTETGTTQSLAVQWQMNFQYPDGPRDCEAIAVDERDQKIYLLSKREKQPTLYALPLEFQPDKTIYTAALVAKIQTIPRPTPADLKEKYGKYRSQPTAMDISSDGRTLVILTYKNGYLFKRNPGQAWSEVVNTRPKILPLPNGNELPQREALCIDREKGSIIVTTEMLPAPIYTIMPERMP